jgi:hypothetical protein
MAMRRVSSEQESSVKTVVCPQDPQERRFNAAVKLWVEDAITHSALMENYPDYESTMLQRIVNVIAARIE